VKIDTEEGGVGFRAGFYVAETEKSTRTGKALLETQR
jgi:hypothetical protein